MEEELTTQDISFHDMCSKHAAVRGLNT